MKYILIKYDIINTFNDKIIRSCMNNSVKVFKLPNLSLIYFQSKFNLDCVNQMSFSCGKTQCMFLCSHFHEYKLSMHMNQLKNLS